MISIRKYNKLIEMIKNAGGNSTTELNELKKEITSFKSKLTDAENKIKSLETRVSTLETPSV